MGRVEQRQCFQAANPERLAAEQRPRQRRSANLWRGIPVPGEIILLRVQPNADAWPEPPAAAGPLVGRRLRNGLDRQSLDLAPGRVAAHAGEPRVDDIPDSRHRQR